MTSNNGTDLDAKGVALLLGNAAQAGTITAQTQTMLSGSLDAVVVAGAAGMDVENIVATDVTLVTVLIDSSTSIHTASLEQAIREGQNALVDAFKGSRENDSVLLALWTFSDEIRVVHSYVAIDDATRLDANNYAGVGGTHLYDTWCDALAANVAYAQRLRTSGTPCKSVVVVITDGEDTGSRRRARDCARISQDLLASEQFVLAFVGVGSEAAFAPIAKQMGIPSGCVAVQPQATPSALRAVFRMVSQSAIRASRGLVAPGAGAGFFGP
jgi:hypothetical protein